MSSAHFQPSDHAFDVAGVPVGWGGLTVIGGPCLAESRELCLQVAQGLVEACKQMGLGYIFKASFDKANRSSLQSARGEGIEFGLEAIAETARQCGIPATTDVHLPEQAALAAQYVQMLQIPAFLSRQTDLLQAAAETGLPVNVKKGQFLAPSDCGNIVAKLRSFGASGILLTERGTTFGYHTLVVDMPGLEQMRALGVPVCFDATHSAQRPGALGDSTGGARDTIPAMARAAAAVGIDALFLEVHPDPAHALSDAATQWPLGRVLEILEPVARIHRLLA